MGKAIKIILIVAVCLIIAGIALMVFGFVNGGFDRKVERKTETVTEQFQKIYVNEKTADVRILPAADGVCRVEYGEPEYMPLTIRVTDGTLQITREENLPWYRRISLFGWEPGKTKIYLPESVYESLQLKTSTGDITVETGLTVDSAVISASTGDLRVNSRTAKDASFSVSTGEIRVSSLTADTVAFSSGTGEIHVDSLSAADAAFSAGTGDVELRDVVAENQLNVTCSTGDIEMTRCDAGGSVLLKTGTGHIQAELLTPKRFTASTSTGKVSVPNSVEDAPECQAKTSTGDIRITVAP